MPIEIPLTQHVSIDGSTLLAHQNVRAAQASKPATVSISLSGATVTRASDTVSVAVTSTEQGMGDLSIICASEADAEGWEEWLHETRLQLTRSHVDWVLHVGHAESALDR